MKKSILALSVILFAVNSFAQIPSYIDTVGLIGWYPFTGNANDSSGHGNNGTVYGATLTTDRFGNPNSAYAFNGSSNYIQVIYPVSLNTANYSGICISAWCKFNTLPYATGTSTTIQPQSIIFWIDSLFSKSFASWWDNSHYKLVGCNQINGIGSYNNVWTIDTTLNRLWYHVWKNIPFFICVFKH